MGTETANLKKCPRCATAVPAEAFVCAHCRASLPHVGPGWWQASDGVWYPPHLHPDWKPAAPKPMSRRTKAILVAVCVLFGGFVLAGAIFGEDEPERDYAGEDACEELADLNEMDLYTDAELRVQVQQVWDDARYSSDPAIRSAARRMLAAVTVGDRDGFADAAFDMIDACS